MRILGWILITTILAAGCSGSDKKTSVLVSGTNLDPKDSSQWTTIEWLDSAERDYGKIAEGQVLQISYRFKNSGTHPLVIERVQPSCGCTIAEQPDQPIAPGQEGIIKATFNSEKHVGQNYKTLFVYANTKGSQSSELKFKVEVVNKKW